MSHELRTPMNGVVGMTELLGRTALSSTQTRLTQTIRSSAQILLQIVNDLLDLSKIQAGKVEFESLPLDLAGLLEECAALFAGAAEAKGIELIVCPPAQHAALLGDPLRIRQIVLNLIGNAVKFTLQGEVVVKADIDDAEPGRTALKIAVSDTGVGMDAATIEKVFEPFTQADESTTRRFGGTGLGLAICRELAGLMGGTVTAESRLNVGSTFHLRLPLKSAGAAAAEAPAPLTQRSVRILTRRPALAEALVRHLAALGLNSVCDARDQGNDALGGEDLLIADLSTHAAMVESALLSAQASRLMIVANAAQIEALGCQDRVDPERVIAKPVQREALCAALRRAEGLSGAGAALDDAAADLAAIGAHVLLVEDEPVNAAVAQGYLEELGCTSVWAQSGREAVARSATQRFDLIMMDLNMPTMDGFATSRLIREREGGMARIPIIALTAHDAKNYRAACLAAGMDDLMSKPYTLDQCAQLLRHWIERSPHDSAEAARAAARPMPLPDASSAAAPAATAPEAAVAPVEAVAQIDAQTVTGLKNLRSLGQSDLYSKLVGLFQPASDRAIAELGAALAADDFEGAAGVCHKFASSAANVGALVFARHVRDLERLCRDRDGVRAARVFDAIRAAHPALIEELTRLQLRESA
jgi:CheY-like chemotaxis protein/HPt (histidine-containing phosphotransfer) domain-containing protein